jgi:hypothetical protein
MSILYLESLSFQSCAHCNVSTGLRRVHSCSVPGSVGAAPQVRMRVARAYVYMTVWPCAAASGAVSGLTATSA